MNDTLRPALKWGIVLGITVLLWTAALHLLGFYTTNLEAGRKADVVATIIPVMILMLAFRERRARQRLAHQRLLDVARYALLIGALSFPITACGLWFYHHFVNPEWLNLLVADEASRLTASGLSATEVATRGALLRAGGTDRAQFAGAAVGTVLLFLALSVPIELSLRVLAARTRRTQPVRPVT